MLGGLYAALRDAIGRAVQRQTLTGVQSDPGRMVHLHQTWGGHPARGLTPVRMAGMLDAADSGDLTQQSALFADMRDRDPHLDAELGKRERAILTLPWRIEPPPGADAAETRQAQAVAELLAGVTDLEDTLLGLMDAAGHGFACLELAWSQPGAGARLPAAIDRRPPEWFRLDPATRGTLELRTRDGGGEALWPLGWLVHRHAARAGYLHRAGLYRVLTWPWIMRQFSLRDMAEWLEIYGLPMRLGTYPVGSQSDDKRVLYNAVRDLGRHAAGIMPEGMRIELLAAAAGQADPFLAMVQHAEAVTSRAILGGSLSSTPGATGMGSGVADLQGEVRRDLLISDARQVASTLTRDLLWPLAAINGLGVDPRRGPRWVFETREPADLTAFSQSLERLVNAGMGAHIPVAWVREQAGIPAVVAGEAVLGTAGARAEGQGPRAEEEGSRVDAAASSLALGPPVLGPSSSLALGPPPLGPFSDGQQDVEGLVDATLAQARPPLSAATLREIIATARDPDDLVAALARRYDSADLADYRELVERALFAADVLGYVNAENENGRD